MASTKKEIISIALLLRNPRPLDLRSAERAAQDAFRGAPEPPRVIQLKNAAAAFGVVIGPVRLGIICSDAPYFDNLVQAAEGAQDYASRDAILEHSAWISVDLIRDEMGLDQEQIYGVIGRVVAELLQPDVLGLMRLPGGKIVGYDISFLPMLRTGKATEVFAKGPPDRAVRIKAGNAELAAGTAEAKKRWGEFVSAFARRRKDQGFAVKKEFIEGDKREHMWVAVTAIAGWRIDGWLNNSPNVISSLKVRDPVVLKEAEVEDWIYTDGQETIGGFQARAFGR